MCHFCADDAMMFLMLLGSFKLSWSWIKQRWAERHKHPHCVHSEPCEKDKP